MTDASPPEQRVEIDLVEARRLYHEEKWTLARVGAHFGCSRSLVWLRFKEAGIPRRDMTAPRASRITAEKRAAILQAYEAGHTWNRMLADLRTTPEAIALVLHQAGVAKRRPGPFVLDVERLRALKDQGWSYRRMGELEGCSAITVWRALNPEHYQATLARRKAERRAHLGADREPAGAEG